MVPPGQEILLFTASIHYTTNYVHEAYFLVETIKKVLFSDKIAINNRQLPVSTQPTHARKVYAVSFTKPVLRPFLLSFGHQSKQLVAHETTNGRVDRVQSHL